MQTVRNNPAIQGESRPGAVIPSMATRVIEFPGFPGLATLFLR